MYFAHYKMFAKLLLPHPKINRSASKDQSRQTSQGWKLLCKAFTATVPKSGTCHEQIGKTQGASNQWIDSYIELNIQWTQLLLKSGQISGRAVHWHQPASSSSRLCKRCNVPMPYNRSANETENWTDTETDRSEFLGYHLLCFRFDIGVLAAGIWKHVSTLPKQRSGTAAAGLKQEPTKLDLKFGPQIRRFLKGGVDDSRESTVCTTNSDVCIYNIYIVKKNMIHHQKKSCRTTSFNRTCANWQAPWSPTDVKLTSTSQFWQSATATNMKLHKYESFTNMQHNKSLVKAQQINSS